MRHTNSPAPTFVHTLAATDNLSVAVEDLPSWSRPLRSIAERSIPLPLFGKPERSTARSIRADCAHHIGAACRKRIPGQWFRPGRLVIPELPARHAKDAAPATHVLAPERVLHPSEPEQVERAKEPLPHNTCQAPLACDSRIGRHGTQTRIAHKTRNASTGRNMPHTTVGGQTSDTRITPHTPDITHGSETTHAR
jgi:hypothetical protein